MSGATAAKTGRKAPGSASAVKHEPPEGNGSIGEPEEEVPGVAVASFAGSKRRKATRSATGSDAGGSTTVKEEGKDADAEECGLCFAQAER